MEDWLSWCTRLPKIELHAHLGGSIRDSTIIGLLKDQYAEQEAIDRLVKVEKGENRSLQEYNYPIDLVTQHPSVLYKITKEVIEDFANENVLYLELRTAPRSTNFMNKRQYMETVLSAVEDAKKNHPNTFVSLLPSINRSETTEQAMDTVNLAIEFSKRGIAGIDLSGPPHLGNFDTWLPALEYARKSNLPLAIHIAEVYNPEETKKMLDLKPERIGHAVYLDESLEELLHQVKIPLELCLTSNVKCYSMTSYDDHHFKDLYPRKYPLCLSTDDKGVFATTLSKEYAIAAETFRLSKAELFQFSYNTIEYSFASPEIKERLRKQFLDMKQELMK